MTRSAMRIASIVILSCAPVPGAGAAQSTSTSPPPAQQQPKMPQGQQQQPPGTTPPPAQPTDQPPSTAQPAPQPSTGAQPGQATPPQTTTPSTVRQQPQGRVFGADAGIIFNQVKPDMTAQFEAVMARLKEALQKSSDPVRKQQAAGWKVFRSVEPGPNGSVLYLFWMNPAVKGADYTVSKILSEAFPTEAQALYKQFSESYAGGQSLVNLQLVQNFGQTPAAASNR